MRSAIIALLLLLVGGLLQAEPLYPLLRPTAADSIRQQLRNMPLGPQRLKLLLRLSQDLSYRNWDRGSARDSAEAYCQQAAALSRRLGNARAQIESSYALGNLWLGLGPDRTAAAKRALTQGLNRSIELHDPHLEADGWYYLSAAYRFSTADVLRQIACLQRAMTLYQTLGDGVHAAYTLKTIADLHLQQGQEELAREELLQALVRYRAMGYRRLHYTYDLLGAVSSRLGDYQGAIRYGLASIESALATQDTTDLNLFYFRVGATNNVLKQYPDALKYYNLALRRAEQHHDTGEVLYAIRYITGLLIALNQPQQALRLALEKLRQYPPGDFHRLIALSILASCYQANRQFIPAEKAYLELIKLRDSMSMVDNQTGLVDAYFDIGRLYLATRQYGKVRLYLDKAWGLQSGVSLARKATLRLLLFRVDSAQGNYLAAIAQQQRYMALHDSMFNEKKSKQIANLQIQYKTREKEQDLALLTKQGLVQQANLRQRESQRNALLAGVTMLALLLGLGYNRYRLKQRSTRQLEARQAEIDRKNAALQTMLREKEWLLKEIHHRVKNNLQVVMSLLNAQASYLANDAALAAIQESQHRVQAMALIHQKLYEAEQVARIAMPVYINELVAYLRDSYDLPQPIDFELAIEPVEVDVTIAVPLGLIINEAITNALKYAFPTGRPGRIRVELHGLPAAAYQLIIEDDGVGLPPNYAPEHSRSLGMTLIHGFSRQLGGELTISSDHGVKIRLVFGEQPLVSTPLQADYAV